MSSILSQDIDSSLRPLLVRMRKNIRYWFFTQLIIWGGLAGCCYAAGNGGGGGGGETGGAIGALVILLIAFIVYFKTNNRNSALKIILKEFDNVKKATVLKKTWKNLYFYAQSIFLLDLLFLWPLTWVLKIFFFFSYWSFKFRIKKFKKLLRKGHNVINVDVIEEDPFYNFLIREGLYEKPKGDIVDDSDLYDDEMEVDEEKLQSELEDAREEREQEIREELEDKKDQKQESSESKNEDLNDEDEELSE